ncbi:MAG: indole-3-glycerol phosphate synthase TrpC [Chloroflexi bacterium]|nr:indole-3-glycerol phosphate synthase TrpC [Chloroflexota bacterium]
MSNDPPATRQTETVLDRIVADKREDLEAAKRRLPLARLKDRLGEALPVRPFVPAIRGDTPGREGIRLIAEVKRRSPSRGVLRADFDPVGLACAYAAAGAAAVSVLTDEKHFGGSLEHLSAARRALPQGPPLLRKDFLFDPYQLYEARAAGADAVLLIAAVLGDDALAQLVELARSLGMAALVEVHDEAEVERALVASRRSPVGAGAEVIGINNRDLRTFEVDLATTGRLRPLVPPERTVVAESGIFSRGDVLRMQSLGVHAVLIGEALVTAPDPAAKIGELMG